MSKTIGNMTLKPTPVGTDAVAIADSEDSNKTKKVLLSSISGGGSNVHIIENITKSYLSGATVYNGTCSDVTAYEDGHIYIYRVKDTYDTNYTRYININNIGNAKLFFNNSSHFQDDRYPTMAIYNCMVLAIYMINPDYSNKTGFYLLDTSNASIKANIWCDYIHFGYDSKCNGPNSSSQQATIRQYVSTISGSSVSIDFTDNYNLYKHGCIKCSDPLTSLTLTKLDDGWGSESVWEKEIQFTTDSTFTMTATDLVGKWIGVNTTATFDPNTTYVVKIKNGYGYIYKVA